MGPVRKRVLFIAYIFPPLARAGVHRTVRFVRYLPELGWDLTVLTVAEPYYPAPSPVDRELLAKIPAGVQVASTPVFTGTANLFRLRRLWRRRHGGRNDLLSAASTSPRTLNANVPAGPAKPGTGAEAGPRQRNMRQRWKDGFTDLLTIPDKEAVWLPYAVARGLALHRRERFDLIYSTAPPFTGHLVAHLLKRLTGVPWVADFRDPWARAPWKSEILEGSLRGRAATYLERQFVRHADRVILNTSWIHREFARHYGAALAHKFTVIPNGFDPRDFVLPVPPPVRRDRMVITHTGALYRKRNPQSFFAACERLLHSGQVSPRELEIRFVGGIASELYASFECSAALQQVITVIPQVSHREALAHQLESDALLILQPGTSVSVPGKIFEYIGMRKRILALTPEGATADIVRENELGPVVDPEDTEGIAGCLLQLIEEHRCGGVQAPSANGAFKRYDGSELTRQLHQEFLLCLAHGRRGG